MNNLRGAKIIYQESKATQPSYVYFLQKDANNFDIIVTSESGVKRRLNSSVDLSVLATKLDKGTYTGTAQDLKNEIDGKLNKGGYEGTAQDLENSIDGKANISHTHNISDVSNLQTSLNLKEDLSNKAIDFSVVNDVLYPSVKAVDDFVKSQRLEVPFVNATSVIINHNLDKLCSVTVSLDDKSFVLCDYYNIDNNNIRVEFSTQQTGKIILT